MSELPPVPTYFTRTIAARDLTVLRHGQAAPLRLEIGEPMQDVETAGGLDWCCPVRWTEGDAIAVHSLYGVDSMQALQQAMQWIGHALAELDASEGVSLRFLDWPFDVATQLPVADPRSGAPR